MPPVASKKKPSSLEIPKIDDVIRKTRESRKRVAEEAYAKLLIDTIPYHTKMIDEIDKAVNVGINSCSLPISQIDIAQELARQFTAEQYQAKINTGVNYTVILSWPE